MIRLVKLAYVGFHIQIVLVAPLNENSPPHPRFPLAAAPVPAVARAGLPAAHGAIHRAVLCFPAFLAVVCISSERSLLRYAARII